jgi:hypothetical protein
VYGIWNSMRKEFQFGILENSKSKAFKRLFAKIGRDAYKWRFDVRKATVPNDNQNNSSVDVKKGR